MAARSTVIIPNYNGIKYLEACLDSLLRDNAQVDILVVDNGSTDGSVELLRAFESSVNTGKVLGNQQTAKTLSVIYEHRNLGFCGGVNAGIKACTTEFVILLNNDMTVERGFVNALQDIMDKKKNAFSANAQMRMMHRPDVMDNAGDYYCAFGWAFDYGKGKPVSEKYQSERQIFAACGGAAIYRRSILNEIGLFDEAHFAYLEDIDIGYRARIAGYTNYYQPKALIYHAGSGTSGSKYNVFKTNLSSRNSIYIIGKNMPFLQLILNLPLLIIGFAVKTLFFMRKGLGINYLLGLLSGFKMYHQQQISAKKQGKSVHVNFKWQNLGHYIKIQMELWSNILKLKC